MDVIKNKRLAIIMFLIPGLLVYLLFVFYPILQGVILSTYRWKTVSVKVFTGFDNYIGVFQDNLFWKSMKNSFIFMLGRINTDSVGLHSGLPAVSAAKGIQILQTIFFIPPMLMTVAVGYIWGYIYSPAIGILSRLCRQ